MVGAGRRLLSRVACICLRSLRVFPFIVVLLFAVGAKATEDLTMAFWLDFELMKTAVGEAYVAQRDRLLTKPSAILSKLDHYARLEDWRNAVAGRILLAWLGNREIMTGLQSRLENEDLTKYTSKAGGLSPMYDKYRKLVSDPRNLPAAWEILLFLPEQYKMWQLVAMTRMLSASRDSISFHVLLHLAESSSIADLREGAAHELFLVLDQDRVKEVEKAAKRHHRINSALLGVVEEYRQEGGVISGEELDDEDVEDDIEFGEMDIDEGPDELEPSR